MILRHVVVFVTLCAVVTGKVILSVPKPIEKKANDNFLLRCQILNDDPESKVNINVTSVPKWSFHGSDEYPVEGAAGVVFTVTGKNRVKHHGINITDLMMYNVRVDEAGSYRCDSEVTVDGKVELLSQTVAVTIYGGIETVEFKPVQHPIEGTKGRIECLSTGKPKPETSWYKINKQDDSEKEISIDNSANTDPRYKLVENDQVLEIDQFQKATDDGIYKCNIHQVATSSIKEMAIEVVGYVRPTFKDLTFDSRYLEGGTGSIVCSAFGTPSPTIKFLKDGNYLTEGDTYSMTPEGQLKLLSISAYDGGSYTCEIENAVGKDRRNVSIEIYLKPKIHGIQNYTVQRGKSLDVECLYGGSPNMTAEWSFGHNAIAEYPVPNAIEQLSEAPKPNKYVEKSPNKVLLKIANATNEDAGEYECIVKNDAGTALKSSFVQIEHGPVVTLIGPQIIRVLEEHKFEVVCTADALPLAGWKWFHDGSRVETSFFMVEADQTKSTLTINEARDHYGMYECEASNPHGSERRNVSVIKTEKPPKPTVDFGSRKPNKAIVTVTNFADMAKSQEPDTVLVKYILKTAVPAAESQPMFDGDWFEKPNEYLNTVSQNFTFSKSAIFTVTKLQPSTDYIFAVIAKNNAGESEWTTIDYTTTDAVAPSMPLYRTANFSTCLETCHIRWEASDDNGSPLVSYKVQYKSMPDPQNYWATTVAPTGGEDFVAQSKQDAESQFDSQLAEKQAATAAQWQETILRLDPANKDLSEYEIELKNLHPRSTYAVRVYSQNGISTSDPTPDLYLRTREFASQDILSGGVNAGAIVAIVVLVVLIFVLIVDVACYYVNQCGLLMCLCVNCCGKTPPQVKAKEIDLEHGGKSLQSSDDKKPLEDPEDLKGDREDTPMISDDKSSTLKKDTSV